MASSAAVPAGVMLRLVALLLAFNGIDAEDQQLSVPSPPGGAVDVPQWNGNSVQDLHKEYYNIFKHGNRNAASHLWSKFLIDRASQMTPEKFTSMFMGFCAVSGSPVGPQDRTRYRLNLNLVGGGKRRGYMYYCCWPCVCDTQDFIRIDTKSITMLNGEVRQYYFAVLGNPCENPEELTRPFTQPFGRGQTTISQEAAEVRCDAAGNLVGAYLSDHGHIIINMFFDEDPSQNAMDESQFEGMCKDRADNGYNSGMGEIFRKVAAITPVKLLGELAAIADKDGSAIDDQDGSCSNREEDGSCSSSPSITA